MRMRDIPIPAETRQLVVDWHGEAGERWLAALPGVVHAVMTRWRLSLAGTPFEGGSASLVLPVTQATGEPAVLKVPFADEENKREADALRHYDGAGVVRLYQDDADTGALLLERLDPGTPLGDHPDADEALACALIRRLWRAPARSHPFPAVHVEAASWRAKLLAARRTADPRLPDALLRASIDAADMLLAPPPAASCREDVVVNRDAHLGNILAARREPWLLIDPKPLVGERAFDAGFLVLDRLDHLPADADPSPDAAHALVRTLASHLDVDPARVRAWALVRAMENACWSIDLDADPAADVEKAAAVAGAAIESLT